MPLKKYKKIKTESTGLVKETTIFRFNVLFSEVFYLFVLDFPIFIYCILNCITISYSITPKIGLSFLSLKQKE